MPFKPSRREDSNGLRRLSDSARRKLTLGGDLWLYRRNGEIRGVRLSWGTPRLAVADVETEKEFVDAFRAVAERLFAESSAIEVAKWFIVCGPLLDQFQATSDSLTANNPPVPTDVCCLKDGVRVYYRRITTPHDLLIHVVNFEIDQLGSDERDQYETD